jgi:hypothetical protein
MNFMYFESERLVFCCYASIPGKVIDFYRTSLIMVIKNEFNVQVVFNP